MYFKEFLRARKTVYVYTIVWGVLFVITTVLSFWLPMGDLHRRGATATVEIQPWPALLGVAALFAAIAATILGSTLSQENDGHLELALTKPYSRKTYAAAMIGVDMAAILICVLVGLAFIVLHFVILHNGEFACCQPYRLVAGPDPLFNGLRFLLFPLAWYAIIAGVSAGLRGAGAVQALIWPVTVVLAGLREIPASGVWQAWHNLFVVLNIFNPLIYFSYHDSGSNATVHVAGAETVPALLSATVLALFVVVGWVAATLQWRRVEA